MRKDRERDTQRLAAAQRELAEAQRTVAALDRQIEAARATVRRERERDAGRLRSAQRAVQSAQREVDGIQREINAAKAAIERMKGYIKAKKRWLDGKRWYEKSWAAPEYAAYAAAQGTAIGARYTEIGALETARAAAIGVLEGAKQTVRGMEIAAREIPIDADPRVAGLFAGRGAALGALEGAKQAVRGMELAARAYPIDGDPRVAAIVAARETAGLGLDAAHLALEAVESSVGAAAGAASFIVENGLGGVLDVRSASFRGALAGVSGGSANVSIELSYLGGAPETLAVQFDFHDPARGARRLAKRLLARA